MLQYERERKGFLHGETSTSLPKSEEISIGSDG